MRLNKLARNAGTQLDFATDRGKETPIHQYKRVSARLLWWRLNLGSVADFRHAHKIQVSSADGIGQAGRLT